MGLMTTLFGKAELYKCLGGSMMLCMPKSQLRTCHLFALNQLYNIPMCKLLNLQNWDNNQMCLIKLFETLATETKGNVKQRHRVPFYWWVTTRLVCITIRDAGIAGKLSASIPSSKRCLATRRTKVRSLDSRITM